MKIIDLLNKIANGEMNGSIFCVKGDFFYNLIVIDGSLYVINTTAKELKLLDNKHISRFIRDDIELLRLDSDEKEEEKKIPEKILKDEFDELTKEAKLWKLFYKYNEIIDCINSKGDE